MTAKCKSNLLGERSADSVVRGRGKGEEKGHTPERENQSPIVEECVFVANSLAKDRAEFGLQGPFLISLNEKLSAKSSMVEESALGFVVPFCACMGERRLLGPVVLWPSPQVPL